MRVFPEQAYCAFPVKERVIILSGINVCECVFQMMTGSVKEEDGKRVSRDVVIIMSQHCLGSDL